MANTIKAAVVQAAPVLFDTPKTMLKLADLAREATGMGANLIVFPEAFVGGYPKGHDFGARLGMRTPEGREEFRRYFESAIDVPGPAASRLGESPETLGVHLVVGVIERDGGTLYCTALTFGPDWPTSRQAPQADADGDGAAGLGLWRRLDLDCGRHADRQDRAVSSAGRTICRCCGMAMYAQGVELYCAPTVDDRDDLASYDAARSPSKGGASCSRPASISRAAMVRSTTRPFTAMTRAPYLSAVAPASSTRSAMCSSNPISTGETIKTA